KAAPPQQELTGPQHDAPAAVAALAVSRTRRAAAPYFSRTVAARSSSAAVPSVSEFSRESVESSQHPGAQQAVLSFAVNGSAVIVASSRNVDTCEKKIA